MTAPYASVLVVVPTLGERLDYLAQTFDSLAAQDHPGLSVVVVGPATASDARALAGRFGFAYADEQGRSLSDAINQGWATAEADVLAWIGDDDLLEPGAVSRATAALGADRSASMVYGRCRYIDGDGAEIFVARPGRFGAWFARYGKDFIPQPGSFQRATSVRAVGGVDPTLRFAMDLDLFLKLRTAGRLVYLPHVQASFRLHDASLTMSNPDPGVESEAVRRRYMGRAALTSRPVVAPVLEGVARVWSALQWRHVL